MDLDEFQKNRLESHFSSHADDAVKARRDELKMTINGAYEWIRTKLFGMVEDGEAEMSGSGNGGMVIGDDDWCYAEMMHYFSVCDEGDTYKTKRQIKAEEERIRLEEERAKSEEQKRMEKASSLWQKHRERVEKWASLTDEEIRVDSVKCKWVRRFVKKHPYRAVEVERMTDEEVFKLMDEENRKAELAKQEKAAKAAAKKAKKEKEALREKRRMEKEESEARRKAAAEAQLTFNFG